MADNLADLTDLIAAHALSGPYIEYDSDGHHADDFYRCGENCKWTSNEGTVNRSAFAAHAAHVALVVEQHTNGRIAELEAAVRKRIQLLREHDGFGAAHADGYMGMNWTAYYEGAYQAQVMAAADLENDLRAALEGES